MKNISSRRAKACSIPQAVKKKVAERDSVHGWPCCIVCGSPEGLPEAHYISRAKGGLGIEENIVTLCRRCHRIYDNGTREQREGLKQIIKEYLKGKYPGWEEDKLYYRKW